MKVGILSTHAIQYYVPIYRALSARKGIDLKVFYCHRQSPEDHAKSGFDFPFDWDVPLFDGYSYEHLKNVSASPNVHSFFGCDTPGIRDIIESGDYDAFIMEGWYVKSFWQAIMACWSTSTPVLVRGDSHLQSNGGSFIKRKLKYPIYRWFIPKFDGYLSVGIRSREYYLHYGAQEEKIYRVPHCVDNEYFSAASRQYYGQRGLLREEWGMPDNAAVFLLIGKLIAHKRPMDFLCAIEEAAATNNNIWGLVAGDGAMKQELEREAANRRLNVSFTGFLNQKEIPKAYAASDCLVMTSAGETWGMVVNEAMASSLPAIVNDRVGSSPDLIVENESGYLFRCGDIKGLARIMVDSASKPGELRCMGRAARNIVDNYSVERSVDALVGALRETTS